MLISAEQKRLLGIAKRSIEAGLETGMSWQPDGGQAVWSPPAASFVTLNSQGRLRGCIGTLEARRPLQEDVAENAFAAAFRDPRFVPLSPQESQDLVLHISVLSTPEPVADCASLADLVAQLKPFEDGLIVTLGQQRATFLPSVWEQLPDRQQFVQQLLRKAGISAWQQGIECQRYGSVSFEGHWQEIRTVE